MEFGERCRGGKEKKASLRACEDVAIRVVGEGTFMKYAGEKEKTGRGESNRILGIKRKLNYTVSSEKK